MSHGERRLDSHDPDHSSQLRSEASAAGKENEISSGCDDAQESWATCERSPNCHFEEQEKFNRQWGYMPPRSDDANKMREDFENYHPEVYALWAQTKGDCLCDFCV